MWKTKIASDSDLHHSATELLIDIKKRVIDFNMIPFVSLLTSVEVYFFTSWPAMIQMNIMWCI